jgi:hypothetical protein
MSDWTPLIVAFVAALPGLYALLSQSRKDNAEAVGAISAAARQLVEPLRLENKELREQNEELEQKFDELLKLLRLVIEGSKLLCNQLEELGYVPVFNPADIIRYDNDGMIRWVDDSKGGEE